MTRLPSEIGNALEMKEFLVSMSKVSAKEILNMEFAKDSYWNERIQDALIGFVSSIHRIQFDRAWFGKEAKKLYPIPAYIDKYKKAFQKLDKEKENSRIADMMNQLSQSVHLFSNSDYDKIESGNQQNKRPKDSVVHSDGRSGEDSVQDQA